MPYDIHYAQGDLEAGSRPPQLFAGDTPAVSTQDFALVVATTALVQFQPLQRNATTGAFEPWAVGLPIAAVTCYGVPIGTSRAALYTEGMFNIDAIAWPAATTEAQVQAAQSEGVKFRKLLYSDKRTATVMAPGTPAGPA